MKRYIKPSTDIHQIELTQMIAESPAAGLKQIDTEQKVTTVSEIDARINTYSVWGDSDEEE